MATSFRSRLKSGETLLGTMATIPSLPTAEILAGIGFDWLFIDGEHGPLTNDSLLALLSGIGDRSATLVRVPTAEEAPIKQILDLGATGIIAPQVNTARQASDVVRFARYSPEGARGVGVGRAHGYGMQFQEYLQRAREETVVVVQAEHRDAVDNIEAIVKVEGIDAILLGPYDLSASYGLMGQLDHPQVVQAIDHVFETSRAAGLAVGMFALNPEALAPFIERGYSLIVSGVDTLHLGQKAIEVHTTLKSYLNPS